MLQLSNLPEECCSKCKFYNAYYYQYDETKVEADYGQCRRFPPKSMEDNEGGFTLVGEDVWCGEFRVK